MLGADEEYTRMDEAWQEALAVCSEYVDAQRQLRRYPNLVVAAYRAIYRDGQLTPAELVAVRRPRLSARCQRPVVTLAPL